MCTLALTPPRGGGIAGVVGRVASPRLVVVLTVSLRPNGREGLLRRVHKQIKPFLVVAVAFLGAIFTNMKTLQYANVETFIVFRSSTPLLIALLDYGFLGRELPSLRSWCSLVLLLCGAIGYVMYDANFEVRERSRARPW